MEQNNEQKTTARENDNVQSANSTGASDQVFRKASLQRISSPEQITDYLQVANPGLWVTLTAIILLLAGVLVWSMMGVVETRVSAKATAKDGLLTVKVKAENADSISAGMTVIAGDEEMEILTVDTDEFGRTFAYAHTTLPDGDYDAEIVTERIHPISFVFPEKSSTSDSSAGSSSTGNSTTRDGR